MIEEGVVAPTFALPALVDGVHRQVALENYLGEDVVILVFYPGDFNPACDEESDLDELDLFTMQKDVTVLGIGPDTLYAHEAFADAYDLHIPLLSDVKREVAEQYDVAFDDETGQGLMERAVFVIDHDGTVTYAWGTRDVEQLPSTEAIKDAIGETGGDQTAFARYRVGHAHYVEGRRAFTSAMNAYGDSEWMLAQSDFGRAREEFTEADEHFDSAARFVDDDTFEQHYVAAEEKATHLWQAADWLAQSSSNYSSGDGAEGQQLRDDAERPLEEARILAEPIDPEAWPPEGPPETKADDEPESVVPNDDDEPAAGVDIDDDPAAVGGTTEAGGTAADEGDSDGRDRDDGDIDDEELAEIEAEIADTPSDDPVDEPPEERRSVIDQSPRDGTDADGDIGDGADADRHANEPDTGESDDGPITDDDLASIGAEVAASNPATGTPDDGKGGDGTGASNDEGAKDDTWANEGNDADDEDDTEETASDDSDARRTRN